MATNNQKIKCPKCGESISIDAVLTHQIEEKKKGEGKRRRTWKRRKEKERKVRRGESGKKVEGSFQ